ncbi:endonuclease domain-containing protein [Parasphingorhabdus sp.]|uniref:endonuclease domain-containing protein n=1 Tax=Parasphingorhabdus sp. TaxID=2709688 RepID=UPI003A8E42D4
MKKRLTPVARKLRRHKTDAEALLWSRLRNRQMENAKFRFQAPFDDYIADFLCHSAGLIIELDGSQHADNSRDKNRDAVMEIAGYRVIRFWNSEIFDNLEGVLEEIRQAVLGNEAD